MGDSMNMIPVESGLWWIRRGDSIRIAAFVYMPRIVGDTFTELCCAVELYFAEDGLKVMLEFPTGRKENTWAPMKCDVAVRKTPQEMFEEGVRFIGPAEPGEVGRE